MSEAVESVEAKGSEQAAVETEQTLDDQARVLVMTLGQRVYQLGLIEAEVEGIKKAILDLNMRAYQLRQSTEQAAQQAEKAE